MITLLAVRSIFELLPVFCSNWKICLDQQKQIIGHHHQMKNGFVVPCLFLSPQIHFETLSFHRFIDPETVVIFLAW